MGVIRKSITFTEQQDTFIKSLIEQGFYTNHNEYIRYVIRKDPEYVDQRRAKIGLEPLKEYLKRKIRFEFSLEQSNK